MPIIDLSPSQSHRLLPLLHQVHELHVQHQPQRYAPLPPDDHMVTHLNEWLARPGLFALGYEDNGALIGYAIYEIEARSATPFRHSETRVMLHQISVDTAKRRQGVGLALMAEIQQRMPEIEATVLAATYASFNTPSAGLMRRAGLRPVMSFAEWRV